jgi:hypothetical protein
MEPNNPIYERQRGLDFFPRSHQRYNCVLVGAGGVGFWFAYIGAITGIFKELSIVDDDKIGIVNLNRLPFSVGQVGKHKASELAKTINKIRPDLKIYAYKQKFYKDIRYFSSSLWMETRVYVSAVDNFDCNKAVYEKSKDDKATYLRLASDSDSYQCSTKQAPFDGGDRTTGYEGIDIYSVPGIMAGIAGVEYLLKKGVGLYNSVPPIIDIQKSLEGITNNV